MVEVMENFIIIVRTVSNLFMEEDTKNVPVA